MENDSVLLVMLHSVELCFWLTNYQSCFFDFDNLLDTVASLTLVTGHFFTSTSILQPHLSVVAQAQCFSLSGHIAGMPDETDAKKILTASSLENWRRPPGCPRTTSMKTIQQDLKSNN